MYSAIQLGIFIGELYKQDILDVRDIEDCFETLVSNLVSVEHADAIEAFFYHTGPTYWFGHSDGPQHLYHFNSAIASFARQLQGEMSVLGRARSNEKVGSSLRMICTTCEEWSNQLADRCSKYRDPIVCRKTAGTSIYIKTR